MESKIEKSLPKGFLLFIPAVLLTSLVFFFAKMINNIGFYNGFLEIAFFTIITMVAVEMNININFKKDLLYMIDSLESKKIDKVMAKKVMRYEFRLLKSLVSGAVIGGVCMVLLILRPLSSDIHAIADPLLFIFLTIEFFRSMQAKLHTKVLWRVLETFYTKVK